MLKVYIHFFSCSVPYSWKESSDMNRYFSSSRRERFVNDNNMHWHQDKVLNKDVYVQNKFKSTKFRPNKPLELELFILKSRLSTRGSYVNYVTKFVILLTSLPLNNTFGDPPLTLRKQQKLINSICNNTNETIVCNRQTANV